MFRVGSGSQGGSNALLEDRRLRTRPSSGGPDLNDEARKRLVATVVAERHDDFMRSARRKFPGLREEDREDCFQQAVEIALKRCEDRSRVAVYSYFLKVFQRRMIDQLRSAHHRREVAHSYELLEDQLSPEDFRRDPVELAHQNYSRNLLEDLVHRLPDKTANVMRLRYFDELAPKDVQAALDINQKQYEGHIYRGLKLVAGEMERQNTGQHCAEINDLIPSFFAGTLTEMQGAQVDSHLAHCQSCRVAVADERSMLRKVAGLVPLPLLISPAIGGLKGLFASLMFWKSAGTVSAGSVSAGTATTVGGGIAAKTAVLAGAAAITVGAAGVGTVAYVESSNKVAPIVQQPAAAAPIGASAERTGSESTERAAVKREEAAQQRADAKAKSKADAKRKAADTNSTSPATTAQPQDQAVTSEPVAPVEAAPAPTQSPQSGSGGGGGGSSGGGSDGTVIEVG